MQGHRRSRVIIDLYFAFIYLFLILFSFSSFTEWVFGFYCFLLTVSVLLLVFLIIIVCLNKRVNDLFFFYQKTPKTKDISSVFLFDFSALCESVWNKQIIIVGKDNLSKYKK